MRPLLFSILILLLLAGCNQPNVDRPQILARVNGSSLSLAEALDNLSPAVLQNDSVKAVEDYRDQWVEEQLILQEAMRLRVSQKSAVREKLQRARNEILIQSLKDFVISEEFNDIRITENEVQQYYLANKEQFVLRERHVRYRHLTTSSLNRAENAKRDLLRAVSWEDVVAEYSINPERDLDESSKFWPVSVAGGNIDQLNTYLGLIGNMEISPIARSGNTFHFVQLVEERAAGEHPDLDWLMDQIKDWLIIEKSRRYYNSYINNLYLRAQANNEIEITTILED